MGRGGGGVVGGSGAVLGRSFPEANVPAAKASLDGREDLIGLSCAVSLWHHETHHADLRAEEHCGIPVRRCGCRPTIGAD